MKILITGGTVFASRYAAEYFVKKGNEVFVINRNSRPQSYGVNLIESDRHALKQQLKDITFDLVFDITAYNSADISDLIDGLGKFHSYIMVSSSAVYPETLAQPFKENMLPGSNIHWGDYGTNKIAAEKTLLDRYPDAYIIRPPYLYGKMNNLYREAFVFDCAEADMPFYVPHDGEMQLQFFDIEDMCRFAEILMQMQPEQKIFNVGNSKTVTVKEWVQACYNAVGKNAVICSAPQEADVRSYFPFRDYSYILDVSEQCKLMTSVRPLEQGLKDSYEWYKNNKTLVRRKDYINYIKENFY